MTTSAQQTVLTEPELECLREFAKGVAKQPDDPILVALGAKGMIDDVAAPYPVLTPAGRHALHVGHDPGCVPGIDS
jgi:hypothetical protein